MDLGELTRFRSHHNLPGFGEAGQARLTAGHVLLSGVGGIGTPAALYLAASGVGKLTLVDPDAVSSSDLARQVLFTSNDVSSGKVGVLGSELRRRFPDCDVIVHPCRLSEYQGDPPHVVLDATDNLSARRNASGRAEEWGCPHVFAAALGWQAQVGVFHPPFSPSWSQVFPHPEENLDASCSEAGVLSPVPGMAGLMAATEAIKVLSGCGEPLLGQLWTYDAQLGRSRVVRLHAGLISNMAPAEITCHELKAWMDEGRSFVLLDIREPHERQISVLPNDVYIQMDQLPRHLGELDKSATTVVYCRSGARSAKVVAYLRAAGFSDVHNLADGINGWAEQIDSSLPIY